ncbi:TolC family protein [Noviherbaspirillum agri]
MRIYFLFHHIIVAALALASPIALSQALSPGLKAAVDAAWQRLPQARTLEARRAEVAAARDAAASWVAGSPSVGLSQRSDRWTDRNGVRETEVSLSAPVWLPGQMSARQTQARAGADDLEAQIASTRLALAGEVRERLWAVAAARELLSEAKNRQQYLDGTADEVMRRVKAGDLARTDGMLAQQEALGSKTAVAEAQAKLQEALARYTTLTGLPDIPAAEPEPLAHTMLEPHPRLLAARTTLEQAQANLNVVTKTRKEPPTVGLTLQRERDGGADERASSVILAVKIPIGTDARSRPLETAAQTRIATATAEIAQTEATLRADIELAHQQLASSQQALEAALARATLAREHARLIEKAFRLGERGLVDMLRAQSVLHEAEVAERQQRVAVGLAHARINQALGVTP